MKLRHGMPEEVGMSAERVRHIVDLAEGWVAQGITPALAVLVARRGVIVIHEAFGRLTPEPNSPPLELDTIFPLASLTKPITATGAMILVEEGLLSLTHPVCQYIPEFVGEGKDAVMVHHLLTHTSGLREEDLDEYAEKRKGTVEIPPPDETRHPWINEYLFLRHDAPLWKPPGTEMSYADYNYRLLGEIMRRISKKSLDIFASERIFGPLGMKDSYYGTPDSVRHRIVVRPADAPFNEVINLWMEVPLGSDGVISTTMDMAIFGQMFLNRGIYGDTRILSPITVAQMTRNQIPGVGSRHRDEFFPEASWGLGWNIHGDKKHMDAPVLGSSKVFRHGGLGTVLLWVDPVYEIVVAYFNVSLDSDRTFKQIDLFVNAATAAIVDV